MEAPDVLSPRGKMICEMAKSGDCHIKCDKSVPHAKSVGCRADHCEYGMGFVKCAPVANGIDP